MIKKDICVFILLIYKLISIWLRLSTYLDSVIKTYSADPGVVALNPIVKAISEECLIVTTKTGAVMGDDS